MFRGGIKTILMLFMLTHIALCKRKYKFQFPTGSEHLPLPSIVAYSIHLGELTSPFFTFTLESMKSNPTVQFVLINVVPNSREVSRTMSIALKRIPNFRIHYITVEQLSKLIKEKLDITVSVQVSPVWFHKICDYKPTLAYLFPEFLDSQNKQGKLPKWWGYVDIDVVWGNITRFSHLFHTHSVIRAAPGATGVAMFYKNEKWGRELFLDDPRFRILLANETYFNLDEFGKWVVAGFPESDHSISNIAERVLQRRRETQNPTRDNDRLMLEYADCLNWAGHVIVQHGSIKIVKGSEDFPPGREVLVFHRPEKSWNVIKWAPAIVKTLIRDMKTYGYFLPHWIPVTTRHACFPMEWLSTSDAFNKYKPFDEKCVKSYKFGNSSASLRMEDGIFEVDATIFSRFSG